jgi:hypothetical protein
MNTFLNECVARLHGQELGVFSLPRVLRVLKIRNSRMNNHLLFHAFTSRKALHLMQISGKHYVSWLREFLNAFAWIDLPGCIGFARKAVLTP